MKRDPMRGKFECSGLRLLTAFALAVSLAVATGVTTAAQDQTEVQQLKAMVESLQKTVQQLNTRIAALEQEKTAAPQQPGPGAAGPAGPACAHGHPRGQREPGDPARLLQRRAAAAPRLNDLTVDPKYAGLFPHPQHRRSSCSSTPSPTWT